MVLPDAKRIMTSPNPFAGTGIVISPILPANSFMENQSKRHQRIGLIYAKNTSMGSSNTDQQDKIRFDITLKELYRVSSMPAPPKAVMDPASTTGLKINSRHFKSTIQQTVNQVTQNQTHKWQNGSSDETSPIDCFHPLFLSLLQFLPTVHSTCK